MKSKINKNYIIIIFLIVAIVALAVVGTFAIFHSEDNINSEQEIIAGDLSFSIAKSADSDDVFHYVTGGNCLDGKTLGFAVNNSSTIKTEVRMKVVFSFDDYEVNGTKPYINQNFELSENSATNELAPLVGGVCSLNTGLETTGFEVVYNSLDGYFEFKNGADMYQFEANTNIGTFYFDKIFVNGYVVHNEYNDIGVLTDDSFGKLSLKVILEARQVGADSWNSASIDILCKV